jgi:hypothetical protein
MLQRPMRLPGIRFLCARRVRVAATFTPPPSLDTRNPLRASSGNRVRISKTTIPQHEGGIEPRLRIGFSGQRPRRSLAGSDGPCAIGERASSCRGSWGRRDQLEGKLQERYGYAKDQTKKDIDDGTTPKNGSRRFCS